MARELELAPVEIKGEDTVDTVDEDLDTLPTAKLHVLADEGGNFPLEPKLNRWERAVIAHELTDEESPPLVGWYRNPSTAQSTACAWPIRPARASGSRSSRI